VKGLDQVDVIQRRMTWQPAQALVTGAGPIGLLAAALLRLRGLEVLVYDRAGGGPKPRLAADLGVTYVSAGSAELGASFADAHGPIDVAIEATGYSPLSFALLDTVGLNGVVVLTGVSGGDRHAELPVDRLNLQTVLGNRALVGTVNAQRRHFEAAVDALAAIQDLARLAGPADHPAGAAGRHRLRAAARGRRRQGPSPPSGDRGRPASATGSPPPAAGSAHRPRLGSRPP
jgi:threonine dehydrogenase-like Zn-dependent dehydrogenase